MSCKSSVLITILFLFSSHHVFAQNIGFQQVTITIDQSRPLPTAIWYPTNDNGPISNIADNAAFEGTKVIRNARIDITSAPVVMLSHGYRGSWRNLNWLASKLARTGYIVAAPNHPGTTTLDHNPIQAAKWWLRVKDISKVLDYLFSARQWRSRINHEDITVIGHSLGGWTALQLVGAKFDQEVFKQQCVKYPNPRVCGLADELGLSEAWQNTHKSETLDDPRITRVVSLDLGLARSFLPVSLNDVDTPVLILAAGVDIGDLPQARESGYLAEHLPLLSRRYKVYENAAHFSFMQLCKPGAAALLEQETAGDSVVCIDGENTSRETLHQQIFSDILQFID
ncbi:alpha/beta hydrolase family protein [Agarivorans sp.]|uniref:alpha/beta hydrolase family protein n=1 Tax=Agarivorans sp. TaxID=1872412 RepID=UPI003CFD1795